MPRKWEDQEEKGGFPVGAGGCPTFPIKYAQFPLSTVPHVKGPSVMISGAQPLVW